MVLGNSAAFTIMNLLPKFKNEMSSSITTSMIINEGNKNVPEEMKEVCYNFPNNTTSSESSKTSIVFLLSLQSFICFLSNGAFTINPNIFLPSLWKHAFFLPCKCDKTIGPKMLWGQIYGGFLTTFSWVIYGGLFSYVKISIAGTCRSKSNSALFWCGVVTQIGSALGALSCFL
ncbi:unnamed protein product [Lepeophtheirus salmonis]|uniref:Riboflavin transporter n=1 Tax=Lepeophtheirus salmonis TaxID=72036 RepID=A0A7R8CVV4_LEPSM|nr:unnamed protein product [Lepeophtheirus salmonis]CAF2948037.1 unnamed protein product [Lepeophtheirus salmonis]